MPAIPVPLAAGAASPARSGPPWPPLRERATATTSRTLARFAPITLAEMDGVSLLNRVDTKYLLSEATLAAILPSLASEYRVLEIDGRRAHRYRTLYFDTPDLDLYRRHRAGSAILPNVVIAELKQSGIDGGSAFTECMRQQRLRPTGVSKYCLGVAVLVHSVEHDAFDDQLRAIEGIAKGAVDVL